MNTERIIHNHRKQGFIAFVTLFLLVIFALIGIAYWYSSRMNVDMLYVESQRIKARNYAQAAIESVKIDICNRNRLGNNDMTMKSSKSKYDRDFEDGGFRVTSIKPFVADGLEYKNVSHMIKGRNIGEYTIWEVIAEGYIKNSKVTAELKSLIKVYRDSIVY